MGEWLPWERSSESGDCRCDVRIEEDRARVDAADCPHDGDLVDSPACRATVVGAIGERRVERVLVSANGLEAAYLDEAGGILAAAGAFASRAAPHDEHLSSRARRDPIGAAVDADGRADPVGSIAEDTGFRGFAEAAESYERALRPALAPAISDARFVTAAPPDACLDDRRELSTEAVARIFDRPNEELPLYHLEPLELRLDGDVLGVLDRAATLVASGSVAGDGAAREAVRRVVDDPARAEPLGAVLEKHTADLGVLVDCFADPAVTDVFATPPIDETPLRVRVDGELAETNVRLSMQGARALASTFRLRSGRAFSRASPMLDAAATAGDRDVRVAGTTDPVSDGLSFAVRAHDRRPWTLSRLVGNGTLPAAAAALLSVAVERGAAILVAGPRGAGKTTLLGALLFELPADVRTLLIEDTQELPVAALQETGMDVQTLQTETGDGPGLPPATVLRGALRLGEGALVVGEVRGEEAAVLYEAMRVGASDSAVLGTIHGGGSESVRERVVADLGVPASSFATTDLVVTLETRDVVGDCERRLDAIEEVIGGEDGVRFASLFDAGKSDGGSDAGPTGRIGRGASRFVQSIATPGESYADVREAVDRRAERFAGRSRITEHDGVDREVVDTC